MNRSYQDLAIRAIAFSMGFVFFMGGWRRFINSPIKHDIEHAAHLANKLVSAAPGSPLEPLIHWLLYRPNLVEWAVYMMSTAEIIVGLGLMLGLLTRLAAIGSAVLNMTMMLIFGWMGYECLDEWTMSALGFAISITLLIYGTGSYSLDRLFNLDIGARFINKPVAIALIAASMVLTVGFYSFYFGIADLHKRTSTNHYHYELLDSDDDNVKTLYVSGGGSSKASYIPYIDFMLKDGSRTRVQARNIDVVKSHFMPWSQSGAVVDNVLKLRLGSKTDIRIPENAIAMQLKAIDNKRVTFDLRDQNKSGHAFTSAENPAFLFWQTEQSIDALLVDLLQAASQHGWKVHGPEKVANGSITLVKLCLPEVGKAILQQSRHYSAMLPCISLSLYKEQDSSKLTLLDPAYMQHITSSAAIGAAADKSREALFKLLSDLPRLHRTAH
ncbi:MAG: DoxX family membrane protein [Pseudomonadales bacterium]|nr:DoxX family membrane protein [Pseudomonadales bacterium]